MKIGFTDIKKVFVTLPIGYYAFGRIPAVLEQHGRGTCYNPLENKIYLDSEQIEKMCGNIPDTDDPEIYIRSCLYHELSHAMLTPKYAAVPYILNVMEDERIETVMKDYFEGVDFFKNITALNNWDGTCDEVPKHPTQAFYEIVRYHIAPPTQSGSRPSHLVKKSANLIKDYLGMNAGDTPDSYLPKRYIKSIRAFYEEVKWFYPEEKSDEDKNGNEGGDGETCGDEQRNGAQSGQRIGDKDEDYISNEQDEQKSKSSTGGESATNRGDATGSEKAPVLHKRTPINPRAEKALKSAVHAMQNVIPEVNPHLRNALDRIFDSFNKKNHGGSAMQCYSGVLNPRNCNREDYRFWDKKSSVNGANKFGSAHLNLFIDVSGSMYDSIRLVNQLLEALYQSTKRHKEITFSVMAMSEGQRKIDTFREPYLTANGGNDLTDDIFKQYRDLQKRNTAVYNLVVFDGCAYSMGSEHNFGAFNHSNCTIISDSDNMDPIKTYAPNAKHIFTNNYAQDFVNGVIKTLEAAFR